MTFVRQPQPTTSSAAAPYASLLILQALIHYSEWEDQNLAAEELKSFVEGGMAREEFGGGDIKAATSKFEQLQEMAAQRGVAISTLLLQMQGQAPMAQLPSSSSPMVDIPVQPQTTPQPQARTTAPVRQPYVQQLEVDPYAPKVLTAPQSEQDVQKEKKLKIDALAKLILKVCEEYNVSVEYLGGSSKGPRNYQLKFRTGTGVRLNKFSDLRSEFIQKGVDPETGLAVPETGMTIRTRSGHVEVMIPKEVWDVCQFQNYVKAMRRSPAETLKGTIGVDLDGRVPIVEVDGVLIGGKRGGGKSTALRTILATIMRWYHPSDLKVLLIDTDRRNLTKFRDAPHLYADVVTTSNQALIALKYLLEVEMEERRLLMDEYPEIDDICEYNAKFPSNPMVWIVVAIEEIAMLSDLTEKEIYEFLKPLLEQSRKYGIVFMLATQRPDKDVLSQRVKANLGLRVALVVSSPENSKIILDVPADNVDASELGINGDMWVKIDGEVHRLQGISTSKTYLREFIEELNGRFPHYRSQRITFPDEPPEEKSRGVKKKSR